MRVILFGATGMVGQGVLRECIRDTSVTEVTAIVRLPLPHADSKVREIVHTDFFDYTFIESELRHADACFFCLGVSAAGMTEAAYSRITYELTLAAAAAVLRSSPDAVFIYVSGVGTDSSERGRQMWARVKGRTENALSRMPFRAVALFRPGYIQPGEGIRSKTGWYQLVYGVVRPLYPLLKAAAPKFLVTTEEVGRAMIRVARYGGPAGVVDSATIGRLGDAER